MRRSARLGRQSACNRAQMDQPSRFVDLQDSAQNREQWKALLARRSGNADAVEQCAKAVGEDRVYNAAYVLPRLAIQELDDLEQGLPIDCKTLASPKGYALLNSESAFADANTEVYNRFGIQLLDNIELCKLLRLGEFNYSWEPDPWTREEIEEIDKYKGPDYVAYNRFLRTGQVISSYLEAGETLKSPSVLARLERGTDILQELILKQPPLQAPAILYRGVGAKLHRQDRVGETYELLGFTSTSTRVEVALEFVDDEVAEDEIGFLEVIIAPTDSHVLYVSLLDQQRDDDSEHEVLLPSGSTLTVLSECKPRRYFYNGRPMLVNACISLLETP